MGLTANLNTYGVSKCLEKAIILSKFVRFSIRKTKTIFFGVKLILFWVVLHVFDSF